MERTRLRLTRVLSAALLAATSAVVFAAMAGGGASSTLDQYQYQYHHQYAPHHEPHLAHFHLSTGASTCTQFQAGEADDLAEIRYGVGNGSRIASVNVSSFTYWARVAAPAATFNVDIRQTIGHPSFAILFGLRDTDQVQLFDDGCAELAARATVEQGQARVTVSGASAGHFYIVRVLYLTRPLLGRPVPSPAVVHYHFSTLVDGVVAGAEPNTLELRPS